MVVVRIAFFWGLTCPSRLGEATGAASSGGLVFRIQYLVYHTIRETQDAIFGNQSTIIPSSAQKVLDRTHHPNYRATPDFRTIPRKHEKKAAPKQARPRKEFASLTITTVEKPLHQKRLSLSYTASDHRQPHIWTALDVHRDLEINHSAGPNHTGARRPPYSLITQFTNRKSA